VFSLTQASKCLTTLTPRPEAFEEQSVAYNPVTPAFALADNSDRFFENTDKVNCPITECSIMQAGCQEEATTTYFAVAVAKGDFKL
jgi:hypothetical protein